MFGVGYTSITGALKRAEAYMAEIRKAKRHEAYLAAVAGLAKFYHQSPDRIPPEKIQKYLLHLLEERKISWSTCNVVLCGLKFFYTQTL